MSGSYLGQHIQKFVSTHARLVPYMRVKVQGRSARANTGSVGEREQSPNCFHPPRLVRGVSSVV